MFHQSNVGLLIGTFATVVDSVKVKGSGSTTTISVSVHNGKSTAIKIPEIKNTLCKAKRVSFSRKNLKQHQNRPRIPLLFTR